MAFEPENKEMAEVLRTMNQKEKVTNSTSNTKKQPTLGNDLKDQGNRVFGNLTQQERKEKRKAYNFTLMPSVREKITQLARSHNYRSDSRFIEDFFKQLNVK